jgi:DNA processing protein
LFVRGDLTVLQRAADRRRRQPQPDRGGIETAREFSAYLAGLGLVITSGLALGIDAAAHDGALGTGRTIAVLGTGPDRVYPAAHRDLARASPAAARWSPSSCRAPARTPAIFRSATASSSGLSLGTLVVEAAVGSGSLITARLASEQGREVFAIPGSIHNPLRGAATP